MTHICLYLKKSNAYANKIENRVNLTHEKHKMEIQE